MEQAVEAEDQALRELLIQSSVRELEELADEIANRQCEALNLYVPREIQKDFHASQTFIRLGLGSNRGGKTLMAAVEAARCLTNQDPHQKFPNKGILYIVGKDLKHVGEVQWAKLASFGAFKMIRDPKTKTWRAWNPKNQWDEANEKLAKPAPPLIPSRLLVNSDIAWEDKKSKIPAKIHLPTGWEARFWSSQADAPQGFAVDCVWFDEEIIGDDWFSELVARGLVDRDGRMWWSATPQARTVKLYELHQRALDPDDKDVEEFKLHIKDNQYLSEQSKRRFYEGLSPQDIKVRWDGEFALTVMVVYPEFEPEGIHCRANPQIPPDWTRYLIVDPGAQTCAVLAVAIPPNGRDWVIYDELYIKRCDAAKFAGEVRDKFSGQSFRKFFIDMRMGRQTQMSTGHTVQWHYSEELRKVGFESIETGTSFVAGSDDKRGREEAFRKLLYIQGETGEPRLKVVTSRCPWFCWEMKKQFYKARGELVTDDRLDRDNHLVTCAEMAAAANLKWEKPAKARSLTNWALRILAEKRERKRQEEGGGGPAVRCGPQGGAG